MPRVENAVNIYGRLQCTMQRGFPKIGKLDFWFVEFSVKL